jgi:hypothetical protein
MGRVPSPAIIYGAQITNANSQTPKKSEKQKLQYRRDSRASGYLRFLWDLNL